jgi:hypothetical protein
MLDYKKGKIYTVRCKTDETLIYVGCTTQSLVDKNKYLVYFYNYWTLLMIGIIGRLSYLKISHVRTKNN